MNNNNTISDTTTTITNTTHIVAVSYPTHTDRIMRRNQRIERLNNVDSNNIKESIGKLLFDDMHDYVLVSYSKRYFIIDPENKQNRTYTKREINYHPLLLT